MVAHGGCVRGGFYDVVDDHVYQPNWEKWHREGHMCTGFGASPDCLRCGRNELAHDYWTQSEELPLDSADELRVS